MFEIWRLEEYEVYKCARFARVKAGYTIAYSIIIVGFFIFVSTCILERVFSHLEGMCSDCKRKNGSRLTSC